MLQSMAATRDLVVERTRRETETRAKATKGLEISGGSVLRKSLHRPWL